MPLLTWIGYGSVGTLPLIDCSNYSSHQRLVEVDWHVALSSLRLLVVSNLYHYNLDSGCFDDDVRNGCLE